MQPKRLLIFTLGLLFVLAGALPACADRVDDYIRTQMTQQSIPGLVLEVIRDGKVVRKQAYGYADLELNVRTTPDMRFEIGSATKSFTAMAIMMLVEEGRIDLEAPLSR